MRDLKLTESDIYRFLILALGIIAIYAGIGSKTEFKPNDKAIESFIGTGTRG